MKPTIPPHMREYITNLGMNVNIDSEADVRRVLTKMGKDGVDMTNCPSGVHRDEETGEIDFILPKYISESVTVCTDRFLTPWRTPAHVTEFVKALVDDISLPKSSKSDVEWCTCGISTSDFTSV